MNRPPLNAGLTNDQRRVIALVLDDRSPAEIAERLGKTRAAVYMHIYRAKSRRPDLLRRQTGPTRFVRL